MFKSDFPIFKKNIVYLDTAASAQKPRKVIESLSSFYSNYYSNVHRGVCDLSNNATSMYEKSREVVANFIGAHSSEVIFTKGATESINLVASSYEKDLKQDDEVLVCISEHHANFVPWQQVSLRKKIKFKIFDIEDSGEINLEDFQNKITDKTKIVAISGMSNVLGVINPIEKIIQISHKKGAKVLVDLAQIIAHSPIDVKKIACDYAVFSGHKLYGPTGIGVLYVKKELLKDLNSYQFGGDMIKTVELNKTVFVEGNSRFEAGTPPIVEAIGLGAAIDYVKSIGWNKIEKNDNVLMKHIIGRLTEIKDINFLGNPDLKKSLISFNVAGIHPNDLGMILSKQNICVRIGHHCAMPLHKRYGIPLSLRVSFGIYNSKRDVDIFIEALKKSVSFFK